MMNKKMRASEKKMKLVHAALLASITNSGINLFSGAASKTASTHSHF